MSLSSIRRRTIWTLVMYQISFLHSIPLRRWLSHGSMFLLTFFSVSVRFSVLLTFWLILLLLLDSRSAIQISWTCSLSSRCWQDLRGATSASQCRHPSQITERYTLPDAE